MVCTLGTGKGSSNIQTKTMVILFPTQTMHYLFERNPSKMYHTLTFARKLIFPPALGCVSSMQKGKETKNISPKWWLNFNGDESLGTVVQSVNNHEKKNKTKIIDGVIVITYNPCKWTEIKGFPWSYNPTKVGWKFWWSKIQHRRLQCFSPSPANLLRGGAW